MAIIHAERVCERTSTSGTGTYSLAGARTGFQSFVEGIGTTNQCYYCCTNNIDWEVGLGTVTDAATDTLSRDTIIDSSNGGAAVDWAAGSKHIYCTNPAAATLVVDTNGNASFGSVPANSGIIRIPFNTTISAGRAAGDGGALEILRNAASDVLEFGGGAFSKIQVNPLTRDMDFAVGGDSTLSVLYVDAGNEYVGVGTAVPAAKLDVAGSIYMRNQDAGIYCDVSPSSRLGFVKKTGEAPMLAIANSSYLQIGHWSTANIAGNEATGTFTERIRVHSDGNIGVNDTSPDAQLDIINSNAAQPGLIVQAAAAQSADLFKIMDSDGTTQLVGFGAGGDLTFYGNADVIQFTDASLAEIRSNGSFMIGIDNDSNQADRYFGVGSNGSGDNLFVVSESGYSGFANTDPDNTLVLAQGTVLRGLNLRNTSVDYANRFAGLGAPRAHADFCGSVSLLSATAGGIDIGGFSDEDAIGLNLVGCIGSADPNNATPAVRMQGWKWNGVNNVVALGNDETVLGVYNGSGSLVSVLGSGSVGIGDTSPDAQLDIINSNAAQPGLIVQAAAAQSADNFQILDSNGSTKLFHIESDGDVVIKDTKGLWFGGATNGGITNKDGDSGVLHYTALGSHRFYVDSNNNDYSAFEIYGNVAEGTTTDPRVRVADTGNSWIWNTTTFDLLNSTTQTQDTLLLRVTGTPGAGSYGASLGFTNLGGSRRPCAIATIQTTADEDQVGLAFFTHPSATGGDNIVETMRLDTDTTSGNTRFLLYDVATSSLKRVKVGANGTGPGGTGRALYIDNS